LIALLLRGRIPQLINAACASCARVYFDNLRRLAPSIIVIRNYQPSVEADGYGAKPSAAADGYKCPVQDTQWLISRCAFARRSVWITGFAASSEKCAVKSGRKLAVCHGSAEINLA
jgi:hypothetical protein